MAFFGMGVCARLLLGDPQGRRGGWVHCWASARVSPPTHPPTHPPTLEKLPNRKYETYKGARDWRPNFGTPFRVLSSPPPPAPGPGGVGIVGTQQNPGHMAVGEHALGRCPHHLTPPPPVPEGKCNLPAVRSGVRKTSLFVVFAAIHCAEMWGGRLCPRSGQCRPYGILHHHMSAVAVV